MVTTTPVLTEEEYLSDKFDYNQCAFGKVTHVIGGTGIGKTTDKKVTISVGRFANRPWARPYSSPK